MEIIIIYLMHYDAFGASSKVVFIIWTYSVSVEVVLLALSIFAKAMPSHTSIYKLFDIIFLIPSIFFSHKTVSILSFSL